MKDQLFLSNPGFENDAGESPFYCGRFIDGEAGIRAHSSARYGIATAK